jgi:hypothetical protein
VDVPIIIYCVNISSILLAKIWSIMLRQSMKYITILLEKIFYQKELTLFMSVLKIKLLTFS